MSKLTILVVTFVMLFPATAPAQIINGSFETPLVPVGSFTNFLGGSTAITGWTVVGVDTAIISSTLTSSGITFNAQSGNQWLDLSGVNTGTLNTSGVQQIVTTVPGQAYLLEFYVGSATGGGLFFPGTVDLSINGGARVSYFNPTGPSTMLDWLHFSVPFTATGAATDLTFFNGSASNNFLSALDNVSLVAVPEPSTLICTALGAVAIAVVGWKKRRGARFASGRSPPGHRRSGRR